MRSNLLDREQVADAQPDLLRVAGAGRGGNGPCLPAVAGTPNPDHPGREAEQARRVRNRLTELLESAGMRNLARPVFEEDGEPARPGQVALVAAVPGLNPPFYIAQQCGKLVQTTWGAIYMAPRHMWQSEPVLVVFTREEDHHASC